MPQHRVGEHTLVFPRQPRVLSSASAVGPKEGRGPLNAQFDRIIDDPLYGQKSYEQAEHVLFQEACEICLQKAEVPKERVQALLGGDLLNQIMASSLAARELGVPFLGLNATPGKALAWKSPERLEAELRIILAAGGRRLGVCNGADMIKPGYREVFMKYCRRLL